MKLEYRFLDPNLINVCVDGETVGRIIREGGHLANGQMYMGWAVRRFDGTLIKWCTMKTEARTIANNAFFEDGQKPEPEE